MKTYFFESGLPRSGSTLFTALLNQHPQIHAGPLSPVIEAMYYQEKYFFEDSEHFIAYPKPLHAKKVISSIIDNYYFDVNEPYIIDKNRAWPNNVERIKRYITTKPKIIMTVRDVLEILSSFITMIHRNEDEVSFVDEALIGANVDINDNNRCDFLMSPVGIVNQALWAFQQSYAKGDHEYIHLIEYNDLIQNPENELRKVYNFLEIESYISDVKNVQNKYREKDSIAYKLKDMHEVRPEVKRTSKRPEEVLSSYVIQKYSRLEFWRTDDPLSIQL